MNAIPDDLLGFDFTWSSCAFEHLGSLEAGEEFVVNQMHCVAPGGVGVHTTEYNVSSDTDTIDIRPHRPLPKARPQRPGRPPPTCSATTSSWTSPRGRPPEDRHVDVPPFSDTHLRTTLGQFTTTSVGLIIERPEDSARSFIKGLFSR